MKKLVVHVAEVDLSEESGMGRISWHWKNEFERRDYEFIHIGPMQVGSVRHPGLFPYAAYHKYQELKRVASVFLIHEPASGKFVNRGIPTAVFSHGIERREWKLRLQKASEESQIKWRTRLFFPFWRLRNCEIGLKNAPLVLLSNQEDADFIKRYYHKDKDFFKVFNNGVYSSNLIETIEPNNQFRVLFLGSWIERKGIRTLVEAAKILFKKNLKLNWLLAGTGTDRETVLSFWPNELHSSVDVVTRFQRHDEEKLFASSNIFVLPSFFEGQPLALLQALESGRCCITTNCCGQRDLIQNAYNGLLYEPGDAQQLASLIEQSVKNKELRISLGRNAKLSVKNRTWESVSAEVVDQIEKMLQR